MTWWSHKHLGRPLISYRERGAAYLQLHIMHTDSLFSQAARHEGSVPHPIATHAKVSVTDLSGLL